MKQRISIKDLEPGAYQAMYKLENYLSTTSLSPSLKELIKIRVSQINGCAYCIESHAIAALKLGESDQRLYALSAWWESPRFTDKEKAALALADEVTLISKGGVKDSTFQQASSYFTDQELAQLIMLISTYNLWNRIAVSTHMFHLETAEARNH